jgi:hypothetical protein
MSKAHRRTQHATFRDVLATVSRSKPTPYSSKLRFGTTTLVVNSWSKNTRLMAARKLFAQGMHVHILENDALRGFLEVDGNEDESDVSDCDSVVSVGRSQQKTTQKARSRQIKHERSRHGKGVSRDWLEDD